MNCRDRGSHATRSRHRFGMALLVVMVLTMLVALAAYRFSFVMESQYRLSRLTEEQTQARLTALSGLEYAAQLLELPADSRAWQRPMSDRSTSGLLAGVQLVSAIEQAGEPEQRVDWRFSLVAPAGKAAGMEPVTAAEATVDTGPVLHRFGLQNESAKLPVPLLVRWDRVNPGAARTALMRLPGATAPLVDQWLKLQGLAPVAPQAPGGLDAAAFGERAEPMNSPIEEGLHDQLQWLWYGGDLNQNYRLDPLEQQLKEQLFRDRGNSAEFSTRVDATDEALVGWSHYLTWTSGQRNESYEGKRRINLNGDDLGQLHRELLRIWPLEWANFVIALRQFGPAASRISGPTVSASSLPVNLGRPATYRLASLLDLVDVRIEVSENTSEKRGVSSPFTRDSVSASNYLTKLFDEACLDDRPFVENAIDASEAPVEVLSAVPGIGVELAEAIVQRRQSLDARQTSTIAWLYTEQLITWSQLGEFQSYLIGRSDVFSVQSIGFRDALSPIARYTAIIDARRVPSQRMRLQRWHPWDRGFDLRSLEVSLRE